MNFGTVVSARKCMNGDTGGDHTHHMHAFVESQRAFTPLKTALKAGNDDVCNEIIPCTFSKTFVKLIVRFAWRSLNLRTGAQISNVDTKCHVWRFATFTHIPNR